MKLLNTLIKHLQAFPKFNIFGSALHYAVSFSYFRSTHLTGHTSYFIQPASNCLRDLNLQRFAAEDEGRTEAPTERRLREEREKGNVAKSNDVSGSVVLLGSVLTLFAMGGVMLDLIVTAFHRFLGQDFAQYSVFTIETLQELSFEFFWTTAKIVAPVMIAAFVMAIVGNVSQFGLLFSTKAIAFKPEKIIPDFKRVLPVRRNLFNLLKILIQVGIIGTAAYFVIMYDYMPLLRSANMELNQAVILFSFTAMKLLIITAIILLALGIPDFFYQRYEYMENLKMSVSESKQEHKETEGDPLMRQKQRERGMDIRQQRNMLEEVPTADVVITNPTHYSVALLYTEGSSAPVVIAKGADHLAFLIRDIAKKNNIHIEQSPEIARSIYAEVDIGSAIPDYMFKVIATIFQKLEKYKRKFG